MPPKRKFLDWFDLKQTDHLKAYRHLCEKCMWPDGFIPGDVEGAMHYIASLQARMATAFVSQILSTEIKDPYIAIMEAANLDAPLVLSAQQVQTLSHDTGIQKADDPRCWASLRYSDDSYSDDF